MVVGSTVALTGKGVVGFIDVARDAADSVLDIVEGVVLALYADSSNQVIGSFADTDSVDSVGIDVLAVSWFNWETCRSKWSEGCRNASSSVEDVVLDTVTDFISSVVDGVWRAGSAFSFNIEIS